MSRRNKNKKSIIVFSFVLFLVILFSVFHFVLPQQISNSVFTPIFTVKDFVFKPFVSIKTTFRDKSELEKRILELEEENAKIKISQLSQTFVNRQIEDYSKELEKNSQGMISKVLNRPPYSSYDTLLILTKGHNIEVGDLAFVRGVYIGDVEVVDLYTATVKLRSTSGEKTLVRIGEMEIEAEGKGGGQFFVKVPKDADINSGDAVTVPLLNYVLLGSVGQVLEDPIATFKTVYFSVPVAFQDMDFVSVVKKQSVLE